MADAEKNSFKIELTRSALVLTVLSLLYYFYKIPINNLVLSYYDDGETLYHTMSFIMGRIPYLEDTNHHFMGYIAPFVVASKFFGFSPSLTKEVALINQVLCGFGVYLCLRFFVPWRLAFLGGAFSLSQREPWVHSFFVQYQINLLLIFIIYFSFLFLNSKSILSLSLVGLISGTVVTFDQRTLHFGAIPWILILLVGKKEFNLRNFFAALLSFLAPILIAIFYLWKNSALEAFYEQTFVFPSKYRIGGKNLSTLILDAWQLHRPLFTLTPLLLVFSFVGFVCIFRYLRQNRSPSLERTRLIYLALLFPFFAVMPLFGSRDYEYYTITWLPYLSIISLLGVLYLKNISTLSKYIYKALIAAPVIIASLGTVKILIENPFQNYRGDGVNEVVEFLRNFLSEDASIYVWGYRPDIYVRLGRLSSYPFATTIFFHPDQLIKTNREKHIYPKYEKHFLTLLETEPPTFIVVFDRSNVLTSESLSQEKVFETLSKDYTEVFEVSKKDHAGEPCSFKIYKRSRPPPGI